MRRIGWRAPFVSCLALALPRAAAACSMMFLPTVRSSSQAVFIGTPRVDTLLTGAGAVKYDTVEGGHFGRGGPRAIYGQLVDVNRIGQWPAATREALRRSGGIVVLVPWDYSADCRPIPWTAGARWMTPGEPGLFILDRLRPRRYWIAGRPTIDVNMPEATPYTDAWARGANKGATTDTLLTLEQMLEFHQRLPIAGADMTDTTYARLAPLQRWVRDHPALARRRPAFDILRVVARNAEEDRVLALRSPLAGTYRFVVVMPPADTMRLLVRTEEHPAFSMMTLDGEQPDLPLMQVPRAVGYSLLAQGARSAGELPTWRYGRSGQPAEGYLTATEKPLAVTADSAVWRGSADILWVLRSLYPEKAERLTTMEKTIEAMYEAKTLNYLPGRFIRSADGRITFDETLRRDTNDLIVFRGERVSGVHMAKRP